MRKKINLLLPIFILIFNFSYCQKTTIKEEKYSNLKNQTKLLSELISDCALSIANYAPDRPYEYNTESTTYIKEYKKVVKGYFHITTEIIKNKDLKGNEIYELASVIYFIADYSISEDLTPILLTVKKAKTRSNKQADLYKEFDVLTNQSQNIICTLTNTNKDKCIFEEYWGD